MSTLPVQFVAAGACYDGNSFEKCALQPQECPSSSIYRTSRWLLENKAPQLTECSSQESIGMIQAMGRCNSSSERFICTSHLSSCRISSSFQPLDPDCTVVNDFRRTGNVFTKSYFGYCYDSSTEDKICAWQWSECAKNYEFRSADPFFAGQNPSCQCDDVKTGACVSTDISERSYFCAATEEVCSSEADLTYMKAFEVEAELGITCRLCDTLPPPPETKVVSAGACLLNREFRRCALAPSNCDGSVGEKFVGPASLVNPLFYTPDVANMCLSSEGVKDVRVGRCVSESNYNLCVPDMTACNLAQTFRANDDTCTLTRDLDPLPQFGYHTTHFGYCSAEEYNNGYTPGSDEAYCAWAFPDCKTSNPDAKKLNYHDADPGWSGTSPNCQCDDVRTGACISDSDPKDRYCAVKSEACDFGYSFVNVRDLEVPAGPNLICRLCGRLTMFETAEHLNSQLQYPSGTSATSPVKSPTASSAAVDAIGKNDKAGLKTNTILGFVIGGILGSACILSMMYFCHKSWKSNTSKDVTDEPMGRTQAAAGVAKTSNTELEPIDEEFITQKNKSVV